MQIFTSLTDPNVAELLTGGAIGVIRTDTLYGVIASAVNETAVNRVYRLKHRTETKSPIVLISDRSQLFDELSGTQEKLLDDSWPGPVSIILPSSNAPYWIRRENASVAYRMPANEELLALIEQTGALIAPSANPEGSEPANSVDEAIDYFGDRIDFYVDGGIVQDAKPSRILRVNNDGTSERLR